MKRLSIPRWLRRTLVLAAVYAAVMYVCLQIPGGWHDWDWTAFSVLDSLQHGAPAQLDASIVYVDFVYEHKFGLDTTTATRARTFITKAIAQKPRPSCSICIYALPRTPCSAQFSEANNELLTALRAAHRSGLKVFATITEPKRVGKDGLPNDQTPNKLDSRFTRRSNYGHSGVVPVEEQPPAYGGELYYHACIPVDSLAAALFGKRHAQDVWSLVDVAADSDHETFPPPRRSPHVCDIRLRVPARYGAVISDS